MEPFYGPGEEQSKTKLAITRALHGSLISHRIFVLFTTDRGWTGRLAGLGQGGVLGRCGVADDPNWEVSGSVGTGTEPRSRCSTFPGAGATVPLAWIDVAHGLNQPRSESFRNNAL